MRYHTASLLSGRSASHIYRRVYDFNCAEHERHGDCDMAGAMCQRMCRLAAGVAALIRIDALGLATAPIDMRAGTERLLARVVQVFGSAQAHHGYLFANAREAASSCWCTRAAARGSRLSGPMRLR